MISTDAVSRADQEGYLHALGPLRILLEDDNLTEIMVVGPDMVYVETHGRIVLTDVHFKDTEHLLKVIDLIVSAVGRRIDTRQPLCAGIDRRSHPDHP